jgi:rhamnose transport system ATP-binding protein
MISSELPEVLGMSDRVLVMRRGRIVAEFSRADATQNNVGAAMMSDQGDGAPEAEAAVVTGGPA